jgi:two-component system nitrogen regulation sensor histidine kinase GlnL
MPAQSLNGASTGYEGKTFENILRDCFSCALITVDSEGKIVSANPEAERVLRIASPQQKNSSLETLPAQITSLIREVFETGQTAANREIVFQTSGKEPVTFSVTAMPLTGKRGPSVVAMFNDFSAVTKLEHNLRRLDRLASVGTLSAGLAHEIRNALVAVKTFVDLLLEKNQDAELSETVRREIGRMDTIVSHMLKYAAPPLPRFAEVRLHEILEHSLRMIQPRMGAKLIALNRDLRADEDRLVGDDHQLEQAFLNLLFNAVDAIGSEGSVTVSTALTSATETFALHDGKKNERWLCVQISDTGAGIPVENLTEIFEPFFTTKPRGTGLGLAVTRRIVEEHGGTIKAESQSGKGTTFTVILPAS